MNRREFCRNLALIASAGALTTNEQLAALERTYLLSAPEHPIAVHDIYLSIECPPSDNIAVVEFREQSKVLMPMAFNFRGSMRWGGPPHSMILTTFADFNWTAKAAMPTMYTNCEDIADVLCGYVKWIDEDGKQQTTLLKNRHSLEREA